MSKPLDASVRVLRRPHLASALRPPCWPPTLSPQQPWQWRCSQDSTSSIQSVTPSRSFWLTSRLRDDRSNSPPTSAPRNAAATAAAPKASEGSTTISDPWSTIKTTQPPSNAQPVFTRLHRPTYQPAPAASPTPGDSASDLHTHYMAHLNPDNRRRVPIDQMKSPLARFGNMTATTNARITSSGLPRNDAISAAPSLPPALTSSLRVPDRPLRLKPSLGRTVDIKPEKGIDLARGIALLGMRLKENDVRGDHIRQRFHERPGLKRKRLKSVRWRKRFLKGFKAMVGLVQHMRAQGW